MSICDRQQVCRCLRLRQHFDRRRRQVDRRRRLRFRHQVKRCRRLRFRHQVKRRRRLRFRHQVDRRRRLRFRHQVDRRRRLRFRHQVEFFDLLKICSNMTQISLHVVNFFIMLRKVHKHYVLLTLYIDLHKSFYL